MVVVVAEVAEVRVVDEAMEEDPPASMDPVHMEHPTFPCTSLLVGVSMSIT